jgi:septum site-determining protein MinC
VTADSADAVGAARAGVPSTLGSKDADPAEPSRGVSTTTVRPSLGVPASAVAGKSGGGAAVSLRGSARGFEIALDNEAPLAVVAAELEARFGRSPEFFQGNDVRIFVGSRTLPAGGLVQLKALTDRFGLRITRIEAGHPDVVQAAANLQIPLAPPPPPSSSPGVEPLRAPHHEGFQLPLDGGRWVAGPVRSGAVVSTKQHLTVVGDVNAGAELRAGGNIVVMGVLRGLAHAGCLGDGGYIVALRLEAQQLRIGGLIARGAGGEAPPRAHGPGATSGAGGYGSDVEIAYVSDGQIVVEPYRGRLPVVGGGIGTNGGNKRAAATAL